MNGNWHFRYELVEIPCKWIFWISVSVIFVSMLIVWCRVYQYCFLFLLFYSTLLALSLIFFNLIACNSIYLNAASVCASCYIACDQINIHLHAYVNDALCQLYYYDFSLLYRRDWVMAVVDNPVMRQHLPRKSLNWVARLNQPPNQRSQAMLPQKLTVHDRKWTEGSIPFDTVSDNLAKNVKV